jgi:hypothetical protein
MIIQGLGESFVELLEWDRRDRTNSKPEFIHIFSSSSSSLLLSFSL